MENAYKSSMLQTLMQFIFILRTEITRKAIWKLRYFSYRKCIRSINVILFILIGMALIVLNARLRGISMMLSISSLTSIWELCNVRPVIIIIIKLISAKMLWHLRHVLQKDLILIRELYNALPATTITSKPNYAKIEHHALQKDPILIQEYRNVQAAQNQANTI